MKLNKLSLNTIELNRIGLNRIGSTSVGSSATDRPYISPDVLSSLAGVWIADGKSNDDPDRAIAKNLLDPDNPFVIINASYTEGSGYADKDSPYYGAFVTDGVDDMIVSQNPVSEMLGGSNELTVVSMIHQISLNSTYKIATTNYLENIDNTKHIRSDVYNSNKTGIYGYTASLINNTVSDIKNILGDKADYYVKYNDINEALSNSKFSVVGRISTLLENSSVAWYWTFIAKRVLTTDEINQVIAYYNLDKYVKPDIYYDVKKQGLTNDTPDEDWYLKDFSGNGRDMTLYNYARTPESGINEEGGLQSDGVDDYGQVTGMPIYKDYTVVADREFLGSKSGSIVSKSHILSNGAFIFETFADKSATTSFGSNTLVDISDFKKISYQSKYIYNGNPIQVGTGVDGDTMWLGTIRDGDARFSKFALWSLMLFPYSLSEFLLERQLRKYKAGTLYPDMIEFRPIVKSNTPYSSISYSVNPGEYIAEGSTVTITITLSNASDKLIGVSSNAIGDISISGDNGVYEVTGKVTKSPQKISIVISSYLTMLGNDTLISNETLIKNE